MNTILAYLFVGFFMLVPSTSSQAQTFRLWDVIEYKDIPEEIRDTSLIVDYARNNLEPYGWEIRNVFYLKISQERPDYEFADSAILTLEWPLEPGVSEEREFRNLYCNKIYIDNGGYDLWNIAAGGLQGPFNLAILSGGFSGRDLPNNYATIEVTGAPITYVIRTFDTGLYAQYAYFYQKVDEFWHPRVSALSEVKTLSGMYPVPADQTLYIPVESSTSTVTLAVYSSVGQLVQTERKNTSGRSTVELDVAEIAPGWYNLVRITPSGSVSSSSFLIKR